MFDVKKELLDTHEAVLTVEVDAAVLEKGMQKASRKLAREINFPGFRKGKAPYQVVLRRIGEEALQQEAADLILEEHYPQLLEQAEVSPQAPGQLEDIQFGPLTFKIRIPLEPVIELGDYLSLRKEAEEIIVTDEELAQALERVRQQSAVLNPVERAAELGDQVTLNELDGTVDDEPFVHDHEAKVVLDKETPFIAPGFVEALVGVEAESEKDFTLTLPEDFEDESLRGKMVKFHIEVGAVHARALPELDDALASTVGSFETLEALREDIRTRILEYKHSQAREAYLDTVVAMLVAQSEVHYPPVLLTEELDDMVKRIEENLKRQYNIPLADFLRLQGKTLEQFREELKPDAEKQLKRGLVLAEFARLEKVHLEESELRQEMLDFLAGLNMADATSRPEFGLDSELARTLSAQLIGRKVMDRLEQIALGQAETAPQGEAEASAG